MFAKLALCVPLLALEHGETTEIFVPTDVSIPGVFIEGEPFVARIVFDYGLERIETLDWMLGAAAFEVGGKSLAAREPGHSVVIPGARRLEIELDLGPYLHPSADFELALPSSPKGGPVAVKAFRKAPESTRYLELPAADLARYQALLTTNRGPILLEVWPDVAPKHAANFLDLVSNGFYDGILFHRVIPGFVIQAGDPTTKDPKADPRAFGSGSGPRKLDAEFSERKHLRGVLSAARLGGDINSATSQFFICHADCPNLDHQYTAYGMLLSGFEALDAIVNAPRVTPGDRPTERQVIERAFVVQPLVQR